MFCWNRKWMNLRLRCSGFKNCWAIWEWDQPDLWGCADILVPLRKRSSLCLHSCGQLERPDYFVLSALSCAMCLPLWPAVLSSLTMPAWARAARIMEQAQLVPAHRRPPHPAWKAAIRFFLRSTLLLSTLIISRLLYSTQLYSALTLLLLYCALLYSSN